MVNLHCPIQPHNGARPRLAVQMVKENEKPRALETELEALRDEQRIIVFANTKRQVRRRERGVALARHLHA